VSLHCSRSHHNLARRDRARLSTYHARLAISITEIARVSPHITLASQSRLQRSRASLSWSHSHRNLARRDRARISTYHTRIAISPAEIARVSLHLMPASQSRLLRSRASLSWSRSHRNLARRDRARVSPPITFASQSRSGDCARLYDCLLASPSRSPRPRASLHVSRPRRNLARLDRARLQFHARIDISLAEIARGVCDCPPLSLTPEHHCTT
jgi:hypothetical protein